MPRKRNRRTPTMLLLEVRDPEQRDVIQIMLEAYRRTGSESSAAQIMGITQQAFNNWKYRLGLEKQIDQISFNLKYGMSMTDDETIADTDSDNNHDDNGVGGRVSDAP